MTSETLKERREHLDVTLSASLLINYANELILIEDRESGKLGLVAGGSKYIGARIETPVETAVREYEEETGNLFPRTVHRQPQFVGNIFVATEHRMKIGIVFEIVAPRIHTGLPISDPKISKLVGVTREKAVKLLRQEGAIYKPEFNSEAILYWVQRKTVEHFWWASLAAEEKAREMLIGEGLGRNPKILGINPLFPKAN